MLHRVGDQLYRKADHYSQLAIVIAIQLTSCFVCVKRKHNIIFLIIIIIKLSYSAIKYRFQFLCMSNAIAILI